MQRCSEHCETELVIRAKAYEVSYNIRDAIGVIDHLHTLTKTVGNQNLAASYHLKSKLPKRSLTPQLSEPQYTFLCILEALFSTLTITKHPLPGSLVETTLFLIRTALFRHHMLTRFSIIKSVQYSGTPRILRHADRQLPGCAREGERRLSEMLGFPIDGKSQRHCAKASRLANLSKICSAIGLSFSA
eukprot:Blabericola_migrator_1__7255@NODE_3685_length_1578_cov_4_186631_g2286_i0_p1_GENE_NODE_3685_length_1578_cov_4_186631_g2286_i0NODE_3685_length_1578_cov_4_186631_g2286_i0_p1_ORF_typecomplete_len188_score14_75DUF1932/PF09130_11/0_23_NODE_3685_length_1578_cov_4_186631_g2286_i05881151